MRVEKERESLRFPNNLPVVTGCVLPSVWMPAHHSHGFKAASSFRNNYSNTIILHRRTLSPTRHPVLIA